jgi:hypothetical protein
VAQLGRPKKYIFFNPIKQGLLYQHFFPGFVLESMGFDEGMACYLENLFGEEILNPEKGWSKIQDFIQIRLDALVASLPDWAKSEQTFQVHSNVENITKSYKSSFHPKQKNEKDRGEQGPSSKQEMAEQAEEVLPNTKTWYHATSCSKAQKILEHGIYVTIKEKAIFNF